jgi:acyl dehydratase
MICRGTGRQSVKDLLRNVSYGTKRTKTTSFGERILPGVCVLSTTIGLANTSNVRGLMSDHGLRLVALLGFEEVRFVGPVFPGDTITVESEILDARPTSDPKRCVARLRDVTTRQTGDRVLEAVRSELYELVS